MKDASLGLDNSNEIQTKNKFNQLIEENLILENFLEQYQIDAHQITASKIRLKYLDH